jgi:hypothetical protein
MFLCVLFTVDICFQAACNARYLFSNYKNSRAELIAFHNVTLAKDDFFVTASSVN